MLTTTRMTLSVAMLVALAACNGTPGTPQAAASQAAAPMTNKDLMATIPGLSGKSDGFALQFQKDGKVIDQENNSKYHGTYIGSWRISGDAVCMAFSAFHNGAERCHGVIKKGPKTYLFTGPSGSNPFTFITSG